MILVGSFQIRIFCGSVNIDQKYEGTYMIWKISDVTLHKYSLIEYFKIVYNNSLVAVSLFLTL